MLGTKPGKRAALSPTHWKTAVGECAEHRGKTYGLVAPLWDMAKRGGLTTAAVHWPVTVGAAIDDSAAVGLEAAALRGKVRHCVLIGRDAPAIAAVLREVCSIENGASMAQAVQAAQRAARPGDAVLLSPACASLDMFRNYAHRGSVFAQAVQRLVA